MLHSVDLARTHEILARYRPIAPKPAPPPQSGGGPCSAADGSYASMSPEKLAAAALRHLPPRASKSRKRGRVGCTCFVPQKRPKATFVPVLPSPNVSLPFLATKTAQLRPVPPLSSSRLPPADAEKTIGSCADLLTLSLVPFSSSSSGAKDMRLDLNAEPDISPAGKDLTLAPMKPHVIVPQPVRPIGSSISVGCISEDKQAVVPAPPTSKKAEEVEEEMESEVLPAVVSDSSNRVRLTNAAYKEMLGQPECSWLDAIGGSFRAGSKRRINGEVMLDLSGLPMPTSANAFSCRVTIEWACNGRKSFVKAPCDVIKLFCDSKDYLFAWKFHTRSLDSDCKT